MKLLIYKLDGKDQELILTALLDQLGSDTDYSRLCTFSDVLIMVMDNKISVSHHLIFTTLLKRISSAKDHLLISRFGNILARIVQNLRGEDLSHILALILASMRSEKNADRFFTLCKPLTYIDDFNLLVERTNE